MKVSTKILTGKISTCVTSLVNVLKEFSRPPVSLNDESLPTEELDKISLGYILAKQKLIDAIITATIKQGNLPLCLRKSEEYKEFQMIFKEAALAKCGTILSVLLKVVLVWDPPQDFLSIPVTELLSANGVSSTDSSKETVIKLSCMWYEMSSFIWTEGMDGQT